MKHSMPGLATELCGVHDAGIRRSLDVDAVSVHRTKHLDASNSQQQQLVYACLEMHVTLKALNASRPGRVDVV
jgi:hypothetical protein